MYWNIICQVGIYRTLGVLIGSSARDSKTVSSVNICPLKHQSGKLFCTFHKPRRLLCRCDWCQSVFQKPCQESVLLDMRHQATLYFGKEVPEELPAPGSTASTWQLMEQGGRQRQREACCDGKRPAAAKQHMQWSAVFCTASGIFLQFSWLAEKLLWV